MENAVDLLQKKAFWQERIFAVDIKKIKTKKRKSKENSALFFK